MSLRLTCRNLRRVCFQGDPVRPPLAGAPQGRPCCTRDLRCYASERQNHHGGRGGPRPDSDSRVRGAAGCLRPLPRAVCHKSPAGRAGGGGSDLARPRPRRAPRSRLQIPPGQGPIESQCRSLSESPLRSEGSVPWHWHGESEPPIMIIEGDWPRCGPRSRQDGIRIMAQDAGSHPIAMAGALHAGLSLASNLPRGV